MYNLKSNLNEPIHKTKRPAKKGFRLVVAKGVGGSGMDREFANYYF